MKKPHDEYRQGIHVFYFISCLNNSTLVDCQYLQITDPTSIVLTISSVTNVGALDPWIKYRLNKRKVSCFKLVLNM